MFTLPMSFYEVSYFSEGHIELKRRSFYVVFLFVQLLFPSSIWSDHLFPKPCVLRFSVDFCYYPRRFRRLLLVFCVVPSTTTYKWSEESLYSLPLPFVKLDPLLPSGSLKGDETEILSYSVTRFICPIENFLYQLDLL